MILKQLKLPALIWDIEKQMNTYTFKTNLRCGECLKKISPTLDGDSSIIKWKVDLSSKDKTLEVSTSKDPSFIQDILKNLGYEASLIQEQIKSSVSFFTKYKPLFIIFFYISFVSTLLTVKMNQGTFSLDIFNHLFMAAFFIVFSFFKMLDLQKFADAYSTYDIIAAKSRSYALAYPFLELSFGVLYLINPHSTFLNGTVAVVMAISSIGVIKSVMHKRKIQCACLGTIFQLPMSTLTIVEDLLMLTMALLLLF